MYSQITSNKRRSLLLIAVFIIFVVGLGWLIDQYYEAGGSILVFAILYSLGTATVSYFAGDKLALLSSGAKEIAKKDAPDLYNVVENLCIADGIPTPKIFVINDPSPNAFATGRKPELASIAFTTGLLERLDRTELEGVAAHELSHVKNYDTRVMAIVVVLVGVVAVMTNVFLRISWYGGGRRRDDRGGGGVIMILGIIGLILAPIVAQLIQLAISRRREYLADSSGALLTRFPEGLARALEKIRDYGQPMQRASTATAHLYIASPFGSGQKLANLFSTHPPIDERIRILRQMGTTA
jgi:heat shock protein HtpX